MLLLQSKNPNDMIYNALVAIAYLAVLTFILRYLWNGTLVKHISILKPVDSLFHTFMLAFAITMFKL